MRRAGACWPVARWYWARCTWWSWRPGPVWRSTPRPGTTRSSDPCSSAPVRDPGAWRSRGLACYANASAAAPAGALVARLLPLAEEGRVARHRTLRMVGTQVAYVGVVVGYATTQARRLHGPRPGGAKRALHGVLPAAASTGT